MIIRSLCFLLLLCIVSPAVAQTDSLLAALDTAKNERKVKVLNELFRANISSNPVKALGYSREALTLATEISDHRGVAASYNNLGVAYKNQGALDKALEYYIRSLIIYDSLHNMEGMATTKNNIATIYSIKGDYGQAMQYMEDSYFQLLELKDEKKLVGSMNNLGNLYIDLQLFDKATEFLQKSYQLSEKLGQPYADPLNNLGNVFFRQGNYQRAIENYNKALQLEQKENNRLGMLGTLANIGIAFTKAKQPKPAMEYLTQAYTLAKELQAYRVVPDILKNMSENEYRLGDVKNAYQTFIKYDSARERVYGEESSSNIARMEVALRLQEKEREYEMLKKQAEIKTLELNNTRLFITMLVLLVLIVLASINFYYMGRRKKFLNKT